jgi:hypothetical protein
MVGEHAVVDIFYGLADEEDDAIKTCTDVCRAEQVVAHHIDRLVGKDEDATKACMNYGRAEHL